MRTYLIAFGLSLLAGLLFTRWIRDFANRHELVDAPTKGRKIHKTAVPRLGGVAVIVATALPLLGLLLWLRFPREFCCLKARKSKMNFKNKRVNWR